MIICSIEIGGQQIDIQGRKAEGKKKKRKLLAPGLATLRKERGRISLVFRIVLALFML